MTRRYLPTLIGIVFILSFFPMYHLYQVGSLKYGASIVLLAFGGNTYNYNNAYPLAISSSINFLILFFTIIVSFFVSFDESRLSKIIICGCSVYSIYTILSIDNIDSLNSGLELGFGAFLSLLIFLIVILVCFLDIFDGEGKILSKRNRIISLPLKIVSVLLMLVPVYVCNNSATYSFLDLIFENDIFGMRSFGIYILAIFAVSLICNIVALIRSDSHKVIKFQTILDGLCMILAIAFVVMLDLSDGYEYVAGNLFTIFTLIGCLVFDVLGLFQKDLYFSFKVKKKNTDTQKINYSSTKLNSKLVEDSKKEEVKKDKIADEAKNESFIISKNSLVDESKYEYKPISKDIKLTPGQVIVLKSEYFDVKNDLYIPPNKEFQVIDVKRNSVVIQIYGLSCTSLVPLGMILLKVKV